MAITDSAALDDRAEDLQQPNPQYNGIRHIIVGVLDDSVSPSTAKFTLQFYNSLNLDVILQKFSTSADKETMATETFAISGGHRLRAGPDKTMVRVVWIDAGATNNSLELTISPIGDYLTYTLTITDKCPNFNQFDPIFSSVQFKFRPGCFPLNCKPEAPFERQDEDPVIDYFAKDYDSFKHTLISAMMERVPGWQATSEADLDQVLIDLFSAAADELSDYQDRVANEAYLGTARKRVSLARHARFMDYHIHQGSQASTWLAVEVYNLKVLPLRRPYDEINLLASTEKSSNKPPQVFMSRGPFYLYREFNNIRLYTWSGTRPALEKGCTTADLIFLDSNNNPLVEADLYPIIKNIEEGKVRYLLIQEHLNPATGKEMGADPKKRQLLELILSGSRKPLVKIDPVTKTWFIRVCWQDKDRLKNTYCFTVECDKNLIENVSMFHGNLVKAYHGEPVSAIFREPDSILNPGEYVYERQTRYGKPLGTICRLPKGPLAYKNTRPGGEDTPISTIEIFAGVPNPSNSGSYIFSQSLWKEVPNFIHSKNSSDNDSHFIVETDEEGNSSIRFGNGINGCDLPKGSILLCCYQVGYGPDGNVGRDKLRIFDPTAYSCRNPFDVTDGKAPESETEIIRRVPEAFRHRQLRAVTLTDYEKRAEEVEGVSRASARYVWTGSWRGVRIAIDPAGTEDFCLELRSRVARSLDVVRLIGEDIEIRPPVFIPLEINVKICVSQDYWPEEIRSELEQEFSTGYTSDGKLSFFHPDLWTFGQGLMASQIIGRIQKVPGIDHVREVSIRRMKPYGPPKESIDNLGIDEIIQVRNDPDHRETGIITFEFGGGRQ